MIIPNGHWIVGGASVRGAAHQRRGMPNQDAINWLPRETTARHFIAAVADGHGALPHVHSRIGAQLAVEGASSALEWFLSGEASDAAAVELKAETLLVWRDAVARHAEALAGEDDWVEPTVDTHVHYGSTLLAMAASDEMTVVLQIGDGDLLLGYPDGRLERPLPQDDGLVGEQTYSLCTPDALSRFRVAVLRDMEAPPDFALLATDGLSKSFAGEADFRKVVAHYRHAMLTGDPSAALGALPDWLASVSKRGSGDDVTLCLAARRAA
jgi:serine/threonine protein phosphatase PrpC